jgi:N-acetylglucosamine-6-phosphate deacetylase
VGSLPVKLGITDIHCHGGGGYYFSDPNPEYISKAISIHKASGTKNLVASLVTDSIDNLMVQIKMLQPFVERGELVGIHLEGPYLSTIKCGAQDPAKIRKPNLDELKSLIDVSNGNIVMVTIAPELEGALELIKYLSNEKVLAAIGHSDGNYDDALAAIDAGASVVTHFNNAMTKLDSPGKSFSSAILEDKSIYLELIVDGVHVDKELVKRIFVEAPKRVILVSDAMSAAGCSDGEYKIGALEVEVKNSVARLKSNGSLAGSTLTLNRAMQNAIEFGVSKDLVDLAAATAPTALLNKISKN